MPALPYTESVITNPDGVACRVLDTSKIDFADAANGQKTALTLVQLAKGGEEIITRNSAGQIESTYTTQAGDAIFENLHNPDDRYVPGNADGTRWQFSDLRAKGYEIVDTENRNGRAYATIRNASQFRILHEVIDQPTCLKDAWGEGQHVFLYPGASLKLNDNGSVSGIDKEAFDNTWKLTP